MVQNSIMKPEVYPRHPFELYTPGTQSGRHKSHGIDIYDHQHHHCSSLVYTFLKRENGSEGKGGDPWIRFLEGLRIVVNIAPSLNKSLFFAFHKERGSMD